MVASFSDKAILKSYVRLPGSGSDCKARISFCDLSRGSSLAASIPVPQSVGHNPNYMTYTVTCKTVTSTTNTKRPRTEDETVAANESNKRLCRENTDENVTRTSNDDTPAPVRVPVAPVTISPQSITNNVLPTSNILRNEPVKDTTNPTKFLIISNEDDMTKLRDENIQLKSENAVLQKQLSLFKQLIRNPQRLESVLQRLNERAC